VGVILKCSYRKCITAQQPVIHMSSFLMLVGCPPLNTFPWSFPQTLISVAAFMCEHPISLFSVSSGGCGLGNLVF
jgi:hypothetical protein